LENAVLDSYAVLAFLFKEKGHEIVLDLLQEAVEADKKLLIATPNWAEVCYMVQRKIGTARWAEVRVRLLGLPIAIIEADQELAETAGEIKAFHKMSLADGFAAALARMKKAVLYTSDPEFKAVEKEQKIVWL
jgi:predicted nucleic acid-binding protein